MPKGWILLLAAAVLAAAPDRVNAQEAEPLSSIPEEFHGSWGFRGECSDPLVINAESAGTSTAPPLYPVELLEPGLILLATEADPDNPENDRRFTLRLMGSDALHFGEPDGMMALVFERCRAPDLPPLFGDVPQ